MRVKNCGFQGDAGSEGHNLVKIAHIGQPNCHSRKMAGFPGLSRLNGWIFLSPTSVAAQGPAAPRPEGAFNYITELN